MLRAKRSESYRTMQAAIVSGIKAPKTFIDATGRLIFISILGFIFLHCMGTSNTKTNDTAQNAKQFETLTNIPHAWPESIDVDREDNIYFTDAYEGSLYRLTRNADGELKGPEEKLIEGLKRGSGISISRNEHALYMGLTLKSDKGTEYKIARIPLEIFTRCERRPYAYEALKVCARTQLIEITEFNISEAPNGVIYHQISQAVYYTYEAFSLTGWLFKRKGHIGRVKFDNHAQPTIIKPMFSPNGIDVEPVQDGLALIVSITLKNCINRIVLRNGEVEIHSSSLKKAKGGLLGNLPDGLLRRPDGSLLVAAFGTGKVFYLSQNGNQYSDPIEIVDGLGNPTDLILGPASNGNGTSLYVTTKKGGVFPWKWISQGRVVEIADIEKKIEAVKISLHP
jgi:sugar lactone lactonase YvrE